MAAIPVPLSEWLSWKLYEPKIRGNKVILVMHLPPGVDAYTSSRAGNCTSVTQFWLNRYSSQFLELMQSYGDVVQIALAGHTHMDDFRVFNTSGIMSSVRLRITLSISPIFGNDPAFSILHYSVKTAAVSDIAMYCLGPGVPLLYRLRILSLRAKFGESGLAC